MILWFWVLQGEVTNKNHSIFTTRVRMATKLGRKITCLDGLLTIESYDPLMTWSTEITWQNKTFISPLGGTRMVIYLKETPNHKAIQSFDHVVLQGHVISESYYASTTRISMATTLNNIVTYLDGLLLIYSPNSLIMWSC